MKWSEVFESKLGLNEENILCNYIFRYWYSLVYSDAYIFIAVVVIVFILCSDSVALSCVTCVFCCCYAYLFMLFVVPYCINAATGLTNHLQFNNNNSNNNTPTVYELNDRGIAARVTSPYRPDQLWTHLNSSYCWVQENMDLYIHYCTPVHGEVLDYLSTETIVSSSRTLDNGIVSTKCQESFWAYGADVTVLSLSSACGSLDVSQCYRLHSLFEG
jgi:hypothetical protein